MKIVSVKNELLDEFRKIDPEMLNKYGRPCLLVAKLKYKGRKSLFAIPFRSNIYKNIPKSQYFPLPPRSTTRPGNRHGLHYTKMFPISKQFLERYRLDSPAATLYARIISKNIKKIISDCQSYLTMYENGQQTPFSTSIDKLQDKLEQLSNQQLSDQVVDDVNMITKLLLPPANED